MIDLSLPLTLKNGNTCKNKLTEHLQDLIGSPYVLLSYDMLHLKKHPHKTWILWYQGVFKKKNQPKGYNNSIAQEVTRILAIASWPVRRN